MRELIADINEIIITQKWEKGELLIHSSVPEKKRQWLLKLLERLHRKKRYITYQKSEIDDKTGKGYIFAFIEAEDNHQIIDEFYLLLKKEDNIWKVYWIDNHELTARSYMKGIIDPLFTPKELLEPVSELPPSIQPLKQIFNEKDPLKLISKLEDYIHDPLFLEQLKWSISTWQGAELLNSYQLTLPQFKKLFLIHVYINHQDLWFLFQKTNEHYEYKGHFSHLHWANILAYLL